MNIFKNKNPKTNNLPPWQDIVKMMHNKDLHFIDEVVDIIYSPDNEHRCVILKSSDNYLTYVFETLFAYHEDELEFLDDDEIPAYWSPDETDSKSIFDNIDILMNELKSEPFYKANFQKN